MKRLFSFMMAQVLVLSLGATAFADENTGSITITNATVDQIYVPYKIFDASISGGENGGFTYSITKDNQFFDDLFGDPTDPNNKFDQNTYFTYDAANNGAVARREGFNDAEIVAYLNGLVYEKDTADKDNDGNIEEMVVKDGLIAAVPAEQIKPAETKQVVYSDLPYGYYLITSSLGTMVTINSTDPDVEVIDKNQKPGDNFTKYVWDEDYTGTKPDTRVDEEGNEYTGKWVTNSSASIGDLVDFKVEFHATNYNGEKQVKYYRINDTKGDALWVEFDSITVKVEGEEKPLRGYYYGANDAVNTKNWDYFGDWDDVEKKPENAQWFLIHRGYDDFDIVIPWMSDFELKDNTDYPHFKLDFGADSQSMYDSSSNVVITYKASIEPNANIDGTKENLFNKVNLSWMDDTVVTPPGTPETDLTVHALGVTKIDGATTDLLAGAVFKIYNDYNETSKTYSNPVYVIPTDVKGVYILDDLKTIVSGDHRNTSRKTYEAYLADYLQGEEQKNEIVTQANGKLVVLGLEAGTYYLEETKAPDGYNKLTTPVVITVGGTAETEEFTFNIDEEGKIVTSGGVKTETYGKVVNMPVINNKGAELPSTGGEGAMKMITIGTMVAMVFAVLLITHKKMSIYHD